MFLTVQQAADKLGVSPPLVYRWVACGRLRHIRPQRDILIDAQAVAEFRRRKPGPQKKEKKVSHGIDSSV